MSLSEEEIVRLRAAWEAHGDKASTLPPKRDVTAKGWVKPSRVEDDLDLMDFHSMQVLRRCGILPAKDTGDRELRLPPPPLVAAVDPHRHNLDTWLLIPDCHIPFEKKEYLDLVIDIGHAIRPYGIAILGDFGDMLSVSTHSKTPQEHRWQLKDEVAAVNERLDQVDAIGAKERRMFLGNHDIRGQKRAMEQMIGLYDTLDPVSLYNLRERGWVTHRYQEHAQIGKLWATHDSGFAGKYAVWQNGDLFGASTIQGHTHNAGVQYFGTVLGDRHVSAVLGWLGDDRYAAYMAPIKKTRNWQHAFGVAYVERDTKNTHLSVIPIVEGRAVVEGRMYQAKGAY